MTDISTRLSVEGPDFEGEYELTLSDCDEGTESHWIDRNEAAALIAALSPVAAAALYLLAALKALQDDACRCEGPNEGTQFKRIVCQTCAAIAKAEGLS